mgnify:CR=1 FL=1
MNIYRIFSIHVFLVHASGARVSGAFFLTFY